MPNHHVQRSRIRQRLLRRNFVAASGALQITLSDKIVRKILKYVFPPVPHLPPTPQQPRPSLRPTLRPWIGVIDQIIREDASLPKKLQTTAMRILQKLRDEYGYRGGYSMVQEYVLQARNPAGCETNPRRLSQLNRRGKTLVRSVDLPEQRDVDIGPPLQEEPKALEQPIPSICYRLSQHPQRCQEPEGLVSEWMRSVLQGAIPIDILAKELRDTPISELEALHAAATKAELPIRNKSMAVLAYLRAH